MLIDSEWAVKGKEKDKATEDDSEAKTEQNDDNDTIPDTENGTIPDTNPDRDTAADR